MNRFKRNDIINKLNLSNNFNINENLPDIEQSSTLIKGVSEIYAQEWAAHENNLIVYGFTKDKKYGYFSRPQQFGLIIITDKLDAIYSLRNIKKIKDMHLLNSDADPKIYCNNNNMVYKFFKTSTNEHTNIVLLETESFADSVYLYHTLVDSHSSHISLPILWNIETFLLFMFAYSEPGSNKFSKKYQNFEDISLYFIKITDNFILSGDSETAIDVWGTSDIIVFDIETAAPSPTRVPTGEQISDVLFSASILQYKSTSNTILLYDMVNLENQSPEKAQDIYKKNYSRIQAFCKKYISPTTTFKYDIKIFTNEYDILSYFLDFFITVDEFSIACGWNSAAYDAPFIKNRAIYHNLPQLKSIKLNNGLVIFGKNVIHIDYMLFTKRFFEYENYKLNTVAKKSLDVSKYDINAVNLRYVYKHFKDPTAVDLNYKFSFNTNNVVEEFDIYDAMYYNNLDCFLVLKLYLNDSTNTTLPILCNYLNLSSDNLVLSEMFNFVATQMLKVGLAGNEFFCNNHHRQTAFIDFGILKTNSRYMISRTGEENEKYCGGFNYCSGVQLYPQTLVCDYVAFYPYVLSCNNLSHETVAIFPVTLLRTMIFSLSEENLNIFKSSYSLRLFVDRRGENKLETEILCRRLVMGKQNHGEPLEVDDLIDIEQYNPTLRVIVICNVNVKRGLLSLFIQRQNLFRDKMKITQKELQDKISELENNLRSKRKASSDSESDSDDDDDDENQDTPSNSMEVDYKISEIRPTDNEAKLLVVNNVNLNKFKKLNISEKRALLAKVKADQIRIFGLYRSSKIVNCSYSGLIGSESGIKSHTLAGIMTAFCAYYIIETAHQVFMMGGTVAFTDTDSVFISGSPTILNNIKRTLPGVMAKLNSSLSLSAKFYYDHIIFAKKTYIAFKKKITDIKFSNFDEVVNSCKNEIITRGITRNGPKLWDDVLVYATVFNIVDKSKITIDTIKEFITELYAIIYNKIKQAPNEAFITMSCKQVDEYKNNCPMAALIRRQMAVDSNFSHNGKLTFYYRKRLLKSECYFELSSNILDNNIDVNIYHFLLKPMAPIKEFFHYRLNQTNHVKDYTKIINDLCLLLS